MIEFDVDMGYLLEAGELDYVVLNDENSEHEPMEFWPSGGECEVIQSHNGLKCSKCGKELPEDPYSDYEGNFCSTCGARIRKAVER